MYPVAVDTVDLEGLELLPWAEYEMHHAVVAPHIFIRRSGRVWVLTDDDHHTYAVVGVIAPTIASTPEAWILLCKPFKQNLRAALAALRDSLKVLLAEYPHVQVKVDAETPCGRKLVEFLGFREYHQEMRDGREYIYYEMRT